LIMEFRKTLINIDRMIIDELGDLFMNVWWGKNVSLQRFNTV
jgi:hypothetical protein